MRYLMVGICAHLLARGFRFPTMTELYFKGDIGPINLYNNPDLIPESWLDF